MKPDLVRFDAPFWAVVLGAVILVGSVGCISLAAAAQDAAKGDSPVLTTDDS